MADRAVLMAFGAGLVVGALMSGLVVRQLMRAPRPSVPAVQDPDGKSRPSPPLTISASKWQDEGFAPMVPPIRLPTDRDHTDHIQVWIKVPDGASVDITTAADGQPRLDFPAGTVADRVESVGEVVHDVRGTRLTETDEMFHVFVPRIHQRGQPLLGFEWARSDADASKRATDGLLAFMREEQTPPSRMPQTPRAMQMRLTNYQNNNRCTRCHEHNLPEQHHSGALSFRATDNDGFFVPQSVLQDSAPIERHRPNDPNIGQPFVTFRCDRGAPTLKEGAWGKRNACPENDAVIASFDLKQALKANDTHAQAVCAARRYLHSKMTARAREAFRASFADCGIT